MIFTMVPLLLALTAPVAAQEVPTIVRLKVCDVKAMEAATGNKFEYIYSPFSFWFSGLIIEDAKHPGCSLIVHGASSYHVRGEPLVLLDELQKKGIVLKYIEADGEAK